MRITDSTASVAGRMCHSAKTHVKEDELTNWQTHQVQVSAQWQSPWGGVEAIELQKARGEVDPSMSKERHPNDPEDGEWCGLVSSALSKWMLR